MPFYTYILKCADDSYYVGHTENLTERLDKHRNGSAARHTAAHLPIRLVHSETFPTRIEAMTRETQLKKWSHAKKEALINGDMITLKSLSKSRE